MHVSEEKMVVAWKQQLSIPRMLLSASKSVSPEGNKTTHFTGGNLQDSESNTQGVLPDP